MTNFLKIITVCGFLALIISSCAKDDPEPVEPEPTPVPTVPPFFSWATNGTLTTVADSSHCYPSSNVIFAFKSGNSNSLEIRLSAFSVGTYAVNSVTGNQLEYQLGSQVYNGTGTVNINASPATKLSGSFTCALNGGTLSSITGTFADVPKR
jgi:hypothetical protein